MKNYIHVRSKIPAKISINGEKTFSSKLDILCTHNIYIAFFPDTKEKYLPCTISTHGDCYPESITKIPYNNNHYEIIYNPAPIPEKSIEITILHKRYRNFIFSISNSNNTYINIHSQSFNHSSTTSIFKTADFNANGEIVTITGTIDKEKKYLLLFNTKTKKILVESTFDKIEKSKNTIKALKDGNSITGYGIVNEFNYITKKLDSYSIYTTPARYSNQVELVPLLFLESIKYKDYKNAKNYLVDKTVSNNHLETFFGDIQQIYFNGYSSDINYTIKDKEKFRNFTFNIVENQIADIEENNLNFI